MNRSTGILSMHTLLTALQRLANRRTLAITLALLAFMFLLRGESAFALEREQRQRALLATVQVVVPDDRGTPVSAGSGTVLDAEQGLILTNFHVVGNRLNEQYFNRDKIAVIGVNPPNLRGVPVFRYYAQVLRADAAVDLALLKVFAPFEDINGALPANLGLTSVDRGASADLEIGDPVYVLGFPGLGGDTVTYTEGIVSGFLDEDRDGVEEWIKTDAEVNHGNSGGLAVDDFGNFVGVPSAGYTDAESAGKISLIRPGDLALTYYDAWTVATQTGNTTQPIGNTTGNTQSQGGSEIAQIVNVTYGAAIDEDGRALNPTLRFPSGTTTIYASFDYRNIPRADALEWEWFGNGQSLDKGVVRRGRSESGSDWLSLQGRGGLANGAYELALSLDGMPLYRGGVQVGANVAGTSAIGGLSFAAGINDDGTPIGAGVSFANVQEIFALFDATSLRDGTLVRSVWFYQDQEVLRDEAPWTGEGLSVGWVSIRHNDGMPVGDYRLEIYLEGTLAQAGAFRVVERAGTSANAVQVIGEVRDADNSSRRINGATIVVLRPDTTVQAWIDAAYDEAMVHARGTSNRNGEYQLDARVIPGIAYSVIAVQDDYRTIAEDGFQIPADADDPYVLNVTMQRK